MKHRNFHVNGKIEFSLYFDPKITDQDQIINEFFEDKDWKTWCDTVNVKPVSWKFSEDLLNVYIDVESLPKKKKSDKTKLVDGQTPFADGKWRVCTLEVVHEGRVIYKDSIGVKSKEQFSKANKFLSDKPERKAIAKEYKGEKLVYRFTSKKINPQT